MELAKTCFSKMMYCPPAVIPGNHKCQISFYHGTGVSQMPEGGAEVCNRSNSRAENGIFYYNFCPLSDPVKRNPILDQFSMITRP